ncbi:MAG: TetR/AcrR family transcriptional regulator, partial [Coprobacillaceae bacterium]
MAEFVRSRSVEHKEERMAEIKKATNDLFITDSYHDITLTTIAQKLDWSRANLYKYVGSKEDIFLEIFLDKQEVYFEKIHSIFTKEANYSNIVMAEIWSNIINENQDYFRCCHILSYIIVTHAAMEKLVTFKQKYYVQV